MSPVGHSLVGLSFAVFAIPPVTDRRWKLVLAFAFVLLANLPDWPLPFWGHDRYDISHSIYVNAVLIGFTVLIWYFLVRCGAGISTRCLMMGIAAWLSHLVLDSFYNHNRGVAICWPFSDSRLNLSMPWFNTLDVSQSPLSQHNLSVFAIEFIAFSPVLVLASIASAILKRYLIATTETD